jgi:hypothetical protein
MDVLSRIPLASIIAVLAVLGGLIALVGNDITYEEFLKQTGFFLAGAGVLGIARNQAGHGVSAYKERRANRA